jgi:hypothetical protein
MWNIDHSIIAQQRVEVQHWANDILKGGNIQIFDLRTECKDGVILLILIESILGESIGVEWNQRPKSLAEKRFNLELILEFLEKNRFLKPGEITADNLLWGGEKYAFNVLWAMKRGFSRKRSQSVTRTSLKTERSIGSRGSRRPSPERPSIRSSCSSIPTRRYGFFHLGVPSLLERTPDIYEGLPKIGKQNDERAVEVRRGSRPVSGYASRARSYQILRRPRKMSKKTDTVNSNRPLETF